MADKVDELGRSVAVAVASPSPDPQPNGDQESPWNALQAALPISFDVIAACWLVVTESDTGTQRHDVAPAGKKEAQNDPSQISGKALLGLLALAVAVRTVVKSNWTTDTLAFSLLTVVFVGLGAYTAWLLVGLAQRLHLAKRAPRPVNSIFVTFLSTLLVGLASYLFGVFLTVLPPLQIAVGTPDTSWFPFWFSLIVVVAYRIFRAGVHRSSLAYYGYLGIFSAALFLGLLGLVFTVP